MNIRTQQLKTNTLLNRTTQVSPPRRESVPTDSVTLSGHSDSSPVYQAQWAGSRSDETRAKMSGGQVALLGFGVLSVFGGLAGLAMSGGPQAVPTPPARAENVSTVETKPEATIELAKSEPIVEQKASFADGRTLLVDRSSKVHANQFAPDPSMAVEVRANTPIFEESYIATLVDRDLTSVPDEAPKFTALGVDSGQSSKLYFDSNLNQVDFGYGALKSGKFFTRPTRMNGRGAGINDHITQYHLSCVYRLTDPANIDGVQLDPGVYRLVTLDPASNVATKAMDKSVCPGHKLTPTGSGIAGDYVPKQETPDGQALHVNPDDIVQIWTLTEAEAAQFQ